MYFIFFNTPQEYAVLCLIINLNLAGITRERYYSTMNESDKEVRVRPFDIKQVPKLIDSIRTALKAGSRENLAAVRDFADILKREALATDQTQWIVEHEINGKRAITVLNYRKPADSNDMVVAPPLVIQNDEGKYTIRDLRDDDVTVIIDPQLGSHQAILQLRQEPIGLGDVKSITPNTGLRYLSPREIIHDTINPLPQ